MKPISNVFPMKRKQAEKQKAENENPGLKALNCFSIIEMSAGQLKTTMNTVLGFLNLLSDPRVSDQARSVFTEYVYTSSSSLLQLFNNLVELYNIYNEDVAVSKTDVNVNQVMNDLNTKYNLELKHGTKTNLNLKLSIPESEEEKIILCDEDKLTKILETLMENAIGFSGEGNLYFGYSILATNEIQFYFHDNGAGISMEKLEEVFKDYINNPQGLDVNHDLAALKMEVARHFAELLGAKLYSKTKEGIGSSFYLTFPLESVVESMEQDSEPTDSVPNWKKKNILIAEDIDSNYILLEAILSETGVSLTRAKNGAEAVRACEVSGTAFDVILMDIVMPEMDGYEAARLIKGMCNTPIIGQTAYSLESEDNKDKLVHFDAFLTKPIWEHELFRALKKYM